MKRPSLDEKQVAPDDDLNRPMGNHWLVFGTAAKGDFISRWRPAVDQPFKAHARPPASFVYQGTWPSERLKHLLPITNGEEPDLPCSNFFAEENCKIMGERCVKVKNMKPEIINCCRQYDLAWRRARFSQSRTQISIQFRLVGFLTNTEPVSLS